ncbi:hypothetical protein F383_02784 [Gossypium arboreum]|uniref:Uncharacterized protein n=1 Tax=Gossypium arboreum TaxID=29729 RepID=A0A0B0MSL5_GOSAR|nr:hypothetical protein F383_02784 [Gossypium arboreum]
MARRVTLVQSILLTIPNYFMQTMLIPKGVCEEIEKIARWFFWGCTCFHLKLTLVGWNSICQPKSCGGLGFHHLHYRNSSFLMKIGFNLVTKDNALWV